MQTSEKGGGGGGGGKPKAKSGHVQTQGSKMGQN